MCWGVWFLVGVLTSIIVGHGLSGGVCGLHFEFLRELPDRIKQDSSNCNELPCGYSPQRLRSPPRLAFVI